MRLIDADALKAVFEEKSSEAVCGVELCKAIIFRINKEPTVDAVPVRHGKWIGYAGTVGAECSLCRKWLDVLQGTAEMNYCPNCGARMDEE